MSDPATGDAYQFEFDSLDGEKLPLAAWRGRPVLVVNTASFCGYTPQYRDLEALWRRYSARGLVVLGVPSNDFGEQEPGSADEIAQFCKLTYDVTFPMFAKVVTKPGPDQSPIYKLLGSSGHLPAWNFSKYVVGKDGQILAFFPSEVTPESAELRGAIMKAVAAR